MTQVGTRGILCSFDDPYFTNVYIILSSERVFVLDTFLGSRPMDQIRELLNEKGFHDWPVVIFNSHADYDHCWGNNELASTMIIGLKNCRERILSEGEIALEKYASHKRGDVILKAPNVTFTQKLIFPEDNVEFFFTPGHTLDSSSCYDAKDKVLFVGDNIESPFPYLNHPNFNQFIISLEMYLKMNWKVIISGHDPIMHDSSLLQSNIGYLRRFRDWQIDLSTMSKDELHHHIEHNLLVIMDSFPNDKDREQATKHLEEAKTFMK